MNAQHCADSAAASPVRPGLIATTTTTTGGDGLGARFTVFEYPAGAGQSGRLEAAAAAARRAGSLMLRARASAWESDFPLGVARQLFELPLAAACARDQEAWLRGPAALVPQVLSLGQGAAGPGGHVASHALYWLVANMSRRTPLTILIDDLQWADVGSLRWLIHLAHRASGLSLTVAAACAGPPPAPQDGLVGGLLAELRRMPVRDLDAVTPTATAASDRPGCPAPATVARPWPLPRPAFGPASLTPHEQRLIGLAVDGRTNAEIAAQFGVSRRAVEFHFTQIYRKLGISRRPQLYRFAPAEAA
jgi:DNA-binding CsgD family transcriptional regulator